MQTATLRDNAHSYLVRRGVQPRSESKLATLMQKTRELRDSGSAHARCPSILHRRLSATNRPLHTSSQLSDTIGRFARLSLDLFSLSLPSRLRLPRVLLFSLAYPAAAESGEDVALFEWALSA